MTGARAIGTYAFTVGEQQFHFDLYAGVKARDYYEESAVAHYPAIFAGLQNEGVRILCLGAAHGLSAVVLAKQLRNATIVASDINPAAVAAVDVNARRNGVHPRVLARRHTKLFDAVELDERFDAIVAMLPPVPVTLGEFIVLDEAIRAHHYPDRWGLGGSTGRFLIDQLITESPGFLRSGGMLVHAHADFLGTDVTLQRMKNAGFDASLIGSVRVQLGDTKLTLAQRSTIERLGYRFMLDGAERPYFLAQTFVGRLNPNRPESAVLHEVP